MATVICIDFGTSTSKVAASIDGDVSFPIPIGQYEEDPIKEYPIDSSLLFAADKRIYFGHQAVGKSLAPNASPQRRLDSLKRRLTTGDQIDLHTILLPSAFNQTGIDYSIAETLILMLAHIVRLSHNFLRNELGEEVLENVSYRFTRPVFDDERSRWVDEQMGSAIAKALLFERRLAKDYVAIMEANVARDLLDGCHSVAASRDRIAAQGLEEPIAAGILHLSQRYDHRSLAAIMDIGGGTTDIALFVAIQPHGKASIDRVKQLGHSISVTKAGDYIDGLLKEMIERSANDNFTERDQIEIDLNIRRWKEDIFNFQETVPTLSGGRVLQRILLHDFGRNPKFMSMQRELISSLFSVLESARADIEMFATASQFPHGEIELIPSGGGAKLPIFSELAKLTWKSLPSNRRLRITVKNPIPESASDYADYFPQLAVALGGAIEDIPRVIGR
jgi:molecular chaperone DnaK